VNRGVVVRCCAVVEKRIAIEQPSLEATWNTSTQNTGGPGKKEANSTITITILLILLTVRHEGCHQTSRTYIINTIHLLRALLTVGGIEEDALTWDMPLRKRELTLSILPKLVRLNVKNDQKVKYLVGQSRLNPTQCFPYNAFAFPKHANISLTSKLRASGSRPSSNRPC